MPHRGQIIHYAVFRHHTSHVSDESEHMETHSILQGVYKVHADALSAIQQLRDAVEEFDFA